MGVLAPKGFDTLPSQFQSLLGLLTQIRDELRTSNNKPSPDAPLARRRRYPLSNDSTATKRFSSNLVITGLLVGGDTAGRGTLQVGTDKSTYRFWVIANQTQPYWFDGDDGIEVGPGTDVTWIPPTGTTAWDALVITNER